MGIRVPLRLVRAVHGKVAASTRNQPLSALLFLYKEVLLTPLPAIELRDRARMPLRLPVVLARDEVRRVLGQLTGVPRLVASLLYGGGLRLTECIELRVKDVDFERRLIVVRRGKGQKDRTTLLPASSVEPLKPAPGDRAGDPRTGSCERVRQGRPAGCARSQVSERQHRVGLAVRLSRDANLPRSGVWAPVEVPPARVGDPARGCGGANVDR